MERRRAGRRRPAPYHHGSVEELKKLPLVQKATEIAAAFHMDPVDALRGTWSEWKIRVACVDIYADALPKSK